MLHNIYFGGPAVYVNIEQQGVEHKWFFLEIKI